MCIVPAIIGRATLLIVVLSFAFTGVAKAQNAISERIPQYLFSEFADGMVVKKNGEKVVTPLNYNVVTEEMIFTRDDKYLALGGVSSIDTVYLNGMVFLPVDNKFYELAVEGENKLMVQFTGTVRVEGEDVGYGVTSQTSRITTLSSITNTGGFYNLDLPDNLLISRQILYFVEMDGTLERFVNERALLKIFRERKSEIKQLIDDMKIDFDNYNDVVSLFVEINK
jgi:hypothetical protein